MISFNVQTQWAITNCGFGMFWLYYNWLVVDLPLWKILLVSWDCDIPNIWKNKKCSKPPTRSYGFPMVFLWFSMFQTTNQINIVNPVPGMIPNPNHQRVAASRHSMGVLLPLETVFHFCHFWWSPRRWFQLEYWTKQTCDSNMSRYVKNKIESIHVKWAS